MIYLESERLILRTWQKRDLPGLIALNQHPDVMRFFPEPWPAEKSETFLTRMNETFLHEGFCFFACEIKETAELIGFVGLSRPPIETHFTPCIGIGWRLLPEYWKKGYATEAASALLETAFTRHNLPEIVSFTTKNNYPSRRVMEKIGMTYDPTGDFTHPSLPPTHPLYEYVLYRKQNQVYLAVAS